MTTLAELEQLRVNGLWASFLEKTEKFRTKSIFRMHGSATSSLNKTAVIGPDLGGWTGLGAFDEMLILVRRVATLYDYGIPRRAKSETEEVAEIFESGIRRLNDEEQQKLRREILHFVDRIERNWRTRQFFVETASSLRNLSNRIETTSEHLDEATGVIQKRDQLNHIRQATTDELVEALFNFTDGGDIGAEKLGKLRNIDIFLELKTALSDRLPGIARAEIGGVGLDTLLAEFGPNPNSSHLLPALKQGATRCRWLAAQAPIFVERAISRMGSKWVTDLIADASKSDASALYWLLSASPRTLDYLDLCSGQFGAILYDGSSLSDDAGSYSDLLGRCFLHLHLTKSLPSQKSRESACGLMTRFVTENPRDDHGWLAVLQSPEAVEVFRSLDSHRLLSQSILNPFTHPELSRPSTMLVQSIWGWRRRPPSDAADVRSNGILPQYADSERFLSNDLDSFAGTVVVVESQQDGLGDFIRAVEHLSEIMADSSDICVAALSDPRLRPILEASNFRVALLEDEFSLVQGLKSLSRDREDLNDDFRRASESWDVLLPSDHIRQYWASLVGNQRIDNLDNVRLSFGEALSAQKRPRIGLAWRGSKTIQGREGSYFSLSCLAAALRVLTPSFEIVSLIEPSPNEARLLSEADVFHDPEDSIHWDLGNLAGRLSDVDLVISVASFPGDVAPLMGIPTIIMAPNVTTFLSRAALQRDQLRPSNVGKLLDSVEQFYRGGLKVSSSPLSRHVLVAGIPHVLGYSNSCDGSEQFLVEECLSCCAGFSDLVGEVLGFGVG